jgi:hypothetical protein
VLAPGENHQLTWKIKEPQGAPVAEIGVELRPTGHSASGSVYLDYLTWDGAPDVVLTRTGSTDQMWARAWVNGMDHFETWRRQPFRLAQNNGTGLLIHGGRQWTDYQVAATLTPHLCAAAGIAARVQGMRRYYALLLRAGKKAALVKVLDDETVLAEGNFDWKLEGSYELKLRVQRSHVQGWIDGRLLFDLQDTNRPLDCGGIALVLREGCLSSDAVTIQPA